MSDERDSADAAGDGAEDTTGGQVALSRPARPTGKRIRQRGATALAEPEEVESGAEELGVEETAKKAKTKKPKRPCSPKSPRARSLFLMALAKFMP